MFGCFVFGVFGLCLGCVLLLLLLLTEGWVRFRLDSVLVVYRCVLIVFWSVLLVYCCVSDMFGRVLLRFGFAQWVDLGACI